MAFDVCENLKNFVCENLWKNYAGLGTIPRFCCHRRQVCNSETTDRHLRGNGDKVMFDFPSEIDSFENPVSVKMILQSVLEMCTTGCDLQAVCP